MPCSPASLPSFWPAKRVRESSGAAVPSRIASTPSILSRRAVRMTRMLRSNVSRLHLYLALKHTTVSKLLRLSFGASI